MGPIRTIDGSKFAAMNRKGLEQPGPSSRPLATRGVRGRGILRSSPGLRCSYLELDEYDHQDRPRPDDGQQTEERSGVVSFRLARTTSPVSHSPKLASKVSKVTYLGIASLPAMLLHWVQPLPTGAWGQEHKGCASYRSNTESALSKCHRLLWRNTCESDRIHKIRITRGS